MSRAANVPAEIDTLCEGCGYVLDGLPGDARCPECGKPAVESAALLRKPPAWEAARAETHRTAAQRFRAFWQTTADCIFRTKRFFRSISVHGDDPASRQFGRVHWLIASVLFGTAGWFHANGFGGLGIPFPSAKLESAFEWLAWPLLIGFTYLCLFGLNSLAARLTTFEATYRGLRLPRRVVLRAMHFHAAHYLPVGILAVTSVLAFHVFLTRFPNTAAKYMITYLYVLCGEVVVAALYLFKTYWVGMRNLMYANRSLLASRGTGAVHDSSSVVQ